MGEKHVEHSKSVDVGAEAFLELLNINEVKYIFINPGTDHVPLIEAIAKFKSLDRPCPSTILCLHESLAMSAAHGYFCIKNKPQVVLIHTDVGTMNVGAALHNAQRGMAGVILCAGRVPWAPEKRDNISHYYQEQMDQAGIVRGMVKWDYELRSCADIHHVVQRAFQIASTEPCGPVYLVLPLEPLVEKLEQVDLSLKNKFDSPSTPQADRHDIKRVAKLLVEARNPVLVTSYLGRHGEAVDPLVKFAEILGMRVISQDIRMNFPTTHPLCAGISSEPFLENSDVILIVDHLVPYMPAIAKPPQDTKVIHIDIDPLKLDYPLWQFPADIRILADSTKAIPALADAVSHLMTDDDRNRFERRFQIIQEEHETKQQEWIEKAIELSGKRPISPEWLAYCIGQVVGDNDIVVNETVTNWPAVSRHLKRTKPATIFHTGGMGLGGGLGMALGMKLAAPESMVLCLVADGCFLFGEPVAALWAARKYNAPFLTIIFNNQGYHAVGRAVTKAYGTGGHYQKRGEFEEVYFSPAISYAQIAQSCGAWSTEVSDPEEIMPAIRNGLDRVRSGEPVVLDFHLESPFN